MEGSVLNAALDDFSDGERAILAPIMDEVRDQVKEHVDYAWIHGNTKIEMEALAVWALQRGFELGIASVVVGP